MTEEELEMMQKLDKADNMLNSGGFGDFDLLIGDVSDPRLDALRYIVIFVRPYNLNRNAFSF